MPPKVSNHNLNGRTLTIASNPSRPYFYWNTTTGIKTDPRDGIEYGIIETLSHYYNFKYNVTFCNYEWGLKLPNGTWTGIIGKLVSGDSDIGVSGITLTNDRLEAVDFSIPFLFSPITFITPSLRAQYSKSLVVDAFNTVVWFLILFSYVCVAFVCRIINKRYSLDLNQFWNLTCILLSQGSPKRVVNIDSLRILYMTWILSVLVLSVGYSASLTMFMAIGRRDTINSIEKLAIAQKLGLIKVIAERESLYMDIIQNTKADVYGGIGNKMFSVPTPEEAMELVRTENYAYVASRDVLLIEVEKASPDTYYLPPVSEKSTFFLDYIAIAFSKKFKEIKYFNEMIRLLIEGGFLLHWKKNSVSAEVKKLEEEKDDDSDQSDQESKSRIIGLNINQLQSDFYLLSSGIAIAFIVLVGEILSFYIKYKYLRRKFPISNRLYFNNKIAVKTIYNYEFRSRLK